MNRREWIVAAGAAGLTAGSARAADSVRAPLRTITRGPHHHWFGYYDKHEFDPTDRFVLANRAGFEHRAPTAEDVIGVGMVDTQSGDEWVPLGESRAWGWQQGCMLQWRPGSQSEVLWNDREGDRFVCRLLDVETNERRVLPRPVYTCSPDGRFGLSLDFARLDTMRPGYGYRGSSDPHADERAPVGSGVWRVDLETGESELLLSLAEAAGLPNPDGSRPEGWHYFNHLLVDPSGERYIVLHRWRTSRNTTRDTGGFSTRMLTASTAGGGVFVLNPNDTSHFIWRDPRHVMAWARPPAGGGFGFYLLRDGDRACEPVGHGAMPRNGHNTYLPTPHERWVLNDTYPLGPEREQRLYLFDTNAERRVDLGAFPSPEAYRGEWRCDLHPRSNRRATAVALDSPHTGAGRQVHLVDLRGVIG